MTSKAKVNYWVDMVIGVAFILSLVTGAVFLVAGQGGYQGGRNLSFQTEILGISRWVWSDLHTWTSLVMVAGVGAHLILHWKWLACMTGRLLRPTSRGKQEACVVES